MGIVLSIVSDTCKKFYGFFKFQNTVPTHYDKLNDSFLEFKSNLEVSLTSESLNSPKKNIITSKNIKEYMKSTMFRKSDLSKRRENYNKSRLNDFTILKLLGKGNFGKVLLVRNKYDYKLYAMKVLKKYMLFKSNQINLTKTEREILEKINHPFIVKLYFAFQTEEKLYLVTEFLQGGELFYHLKNEKIFSEKKARSYICEIILAIEHLHKNNIIYRDLKPENILLDCDGHIKLADFGLSKFLANSKNNKLNSSLCIEIQESDLTRSETSSTNDKAFTLCGTPDYLAPEILVGKGYDKSVDWWSLGILLYEMLCGAYPFRKSREKPLDIENYFQPVKFLNQNISDNAKNLIFFLLKINPNERLGNANDIKLHPFFKGVDWKDVLMKKIKPEFVPKRLFKSEEDLVCFDENFTQTSIFDEIEKDNSDYPNREIDEKSNYLTNTKILKRKRLDKLNKDFENFSFTRDELKEVKLNA